jgi:hypothetical protein
MGNNCDNKSRVFPLSAASLMEDADIAMIATHIPMDWRQAVFSTPFLH